MVVSVIGTSQFPHGKFWKLTLCSGQMPVDVLQASKAVDTSPTIPGKRPWTAGAKTVAAIIAMALISWMEHCSSHKSNATFHIPSIRHLRNITSCLYQALLVIAALKILLVRPLLEGIYPDLRRQIQHCIRPSLLAVIGHFPRLVSLV